MPGYETKSSHFSLDIIFVVTEFRDFSPDLHKISKKICDVFNILYYLYRYKLVLLHSCDIVIGVDIAK